jgi:hypothetical protein
LNGKEREKTCFAKTNLRPHLKERGKDQQYIEFLSAGSDGNAAICLAAVAPSKNRLFEPFIYKNEHFTKTGSGQA